MALQKLMVTNSTYYVEDGGSEIKFYALPGERCFNSLWVLQLYSKNERDERFAALRVCPRTPSPFSFISPWSHSAPVACAPLVALASLLPAMDGSISTKVRKINRFTCPFWYHLLKVLCHCHSSDLGAICTDSNSPGSHSLVRAMLCVTSQADVWALPQHTLSILQKPVLGLSGGSVSILALRKATQERINDADLALW